MYVAILSPQCRAMSLHKDSYQILKCGTISGNDSYKYKFHIGED
jgi:hypothetical protein